MSNLTSNPEFCVDRK